MNKSKRVKQFFKKFNKYTLIYFIYLVHQILLYYFENNFDTYFSKLHEFGIYNVFQSKPMHIIKGNHNYHPIHHSNHVVSAFE